eukprot:3811538-Rhodomonas_salina.6
MSGTDVSACDGLPDWKEIAPRYGYCTRASGTTAGTILAPVLRIRYAMSDMDIGHDLSAMSATDVWCAATRSIVKILQEKRALIVHFPLWS